jgi:cytochrome c peroxidase
MATLPTNSSSSAHSPRSLAARAFFQSKFTSWLLILAVVAMTLGLAAKIKWHPQDAPTFAIASTTSIDADEPIQPIVVPTTLDARKVALGRKLFHDPRLSADNQISCASCHNLTFGGTDRKTHSNGIHGAVGIINAPSVLNSANNFAQFWDGRAASLEKQIDDPVTSKIEMGSAWPDVLAKLNTSPDYQQSFRQIYGGDPQPDGVKDAIAEFERSLVTPNSRFDRYLRHEPNVLTAREIRGYALFKSLGCASCHQGVNVGGNMYQKLGVMAPYFSDRGNVSKVDYGRYNVTGDPQDMYMFKVPSLRNVALTAPYFHDGKAATLQDAVRLMAKYQLGRQLSDEEIDLIVEFLKTLTGELDGKPL